MLEIVVATIEDAKNAIQGGADSLEIVKEFALGGLTPDTVLVEDICNLSASVAINVIIRPHANNFVYNSEDLSQMAESMANLKHLNISSFVFGGLDINDNLDHEALQFITECASPIPLTFHRAIDRCQPDILGEMPDSVVRILTSGRATDAWAGQQQIREWVLAWQNRFQFVCAGGVNLENMTHLHTVTNTHVMHIGSGVRKNDIVDRELVEIAKNKMTHTSKNA